MVADAGAGVVGIVVAVVVAVAVAVAVVGERAGGQAMTPDRKRAWHGVFEMFAACWPHFRAPSKGMIMTWELALEDLSERELVTAAVEVIKHHSGPPPSPGKLREIVRGRVIRQPVYVTDCWNRRVLKSTGEPIIEDWKEVRIEPERRLLEG